ncbi:MAG TPA: WG repeat-containing protein [Candidatus Limiplasma sp.]|nr:WG repeat-containing protein [Candidatus Limiplasma sp.]
MRQNWKWGFVDRNGEVIVETIWDSASEFSEGLAGVERDGKWGFINIYGDLVIDLKWDDVWIFSDGYCRVEKMVSMIISTTEEMLL